MSSATAARILTGTVVSLETTLPVSGLVAKANFFIPPGPLALNEFCSHTTVVRSDAGGSLLLQTLQCPWVATGRTAVRKRQFHPAGFPRSKGFGNQVRSPVSLREKTTTITPHK